MTKQFLTTATLSMALLLGSASLCAEAASLTIGNGSGGTTAAATNGANAGTVGIGSGNGPLVTLDNAGNPVGNGSQTNGRININNLNSGDSSPLASANNSGDPTGDNSATSGSVNLGSLLDGLNLGDVTTLPGAGDGTAAGGSGNGLQTFAANLSSKNRDAINIRCRNVLADPTIYKDNVVKLCRMVAQL